MHGSLLPTASSRRSITGSSAGSLGVSGHTVADMGVGLASRPGQPEAPSGRPPTALSFQPARRSRAPTLLTQAGAASTAPYTPSSSTAHRRRNRRRGDHGLQEGRAPPSAPSTAEGGGRRGFQQGTSAGIMNPLWAIPARPSRAVMAPGAVTSHPCEVIHRLHEAVIEADIDGCFAHDASMAAGCERSAHYCADSAWSGSRRIPPF